MKKLDGNHLVSIGEEGFFGQDRPEAVHNPAEWGGQIGQDFVLDHMPAAIDFATVHTWPDNWQRWDPTPLALSSQRTRLPTRRWLM